MLLRSPFAAATLQRLLFQQYILRRRLVLVQRTSQHDTRSLEPVKEIHALKMTFVCVWKIEKYRIHGYIQLYSGQLADVFRSKIM